MSSSTKTRPAALKVRTTYHHPDGRELFFIPLRPRHVGWSHKVILRSPGDPIAGVIDWLADTHRPSRQTAAHFFDKHQTH